MEIRKLSAAEIPQLAALERRCFSDPWSERAFESELVNPLSLWLVAMDGERVMGYCGSQQVFEEADIMNVAVCPEDRRQGVADALLEELERRLAENGAETVALEVRVSNAGAIALYERRGYTQAGLRKNYYFHPREDAYILKKQIKI